MDPLHSPTVTLVEPTKKEKKHPLQTIFVWRAYDEKTILGTLFHIYHDR